MPIATPEVYADMLDRAKAGAFAYPAINVTSSQTLNAALRGFAEAESDGIVQVSTGGAEYLSGSTVKDMVLGAQALAEYAHHVAKGYNVNIALHTDHCPKNKLDGFMRPLIAISQERVAEGREPLFQSHMWDGSAVPLEENLEIARELLAECAKARIVMELEVGVVGGEEDGVDNEINEKLYTTPEDFEKTIDALGSGENGRYLLAATFGNVHGVYKPGNVKLRPSILRDGQDAAVAQARPRRGRQAVRPRLPRRLRLDARGDPRGARLRRREDEHRHRHAVRVHPPGRRPHVQELRRRAEDRRRGRQQEAVRPARLGQVRRGRHGRPRRRGLREPALHGHDQHEVARVAPTPPWPSPPGGLGRCGAWSAAGPCGALAVSAPRSGPSGRARSAAHAAVTRERRCQESWRRPGQVGPRAGRGRGESRCALPARPTPRAQPSLLATTAFVVSVVSLARLAAVGPAPAFVRLYAEAVGVTPPGVPIVVPAGSEPRWVGGTRVVAPGDSTAAVPGSAAERLADETLAWLRAGTVPGRAPPSRT